MGSIAKSATNMVPDLSQASNNLPMATLKSKIEESMPLGLVRLDGDGLLVVCDSESSKFESRKANRALLTWLHSYWLLHRPTWKARSILRVHKMGNARDLLCSSWYRRSLILGRVRRDQAGCDWKAHAGHRGAIDTVIVFGAYGGLG